MKKKFVLTLALVLMVAATLVAATPIEVSGSFSAGYKFDFGNTSGVSRTGGTADVVTLLNFTGDFWKVSLSDGSAVLFEDENTPITAKAEIYLDKALAAEGVDMGDVALTLHVGTGVGKAGPNVFADVKDGYKKNVSMSGTDNFGVTLGYADLGSLYMAYDPVDGKSFVVGVKTTPIDGVSAALGFTNDLAGDNALNVSAAADVAALADLDFDLKVTAEYTATLSDPVASHIAADVSAKYEGIGLWVAYNTNDLKKHEMAAKASYSTKIEDIGLSAGVLFAVTDFSDFGGTWDVTADAKATYALGGVDYSLAAKYAVQAKTFSLTPALSISF